MLKKKPTEKSFKWEDQVQAISAIVLTVIAVIPFIVGLGQKLEIFGAFFINFHKLLL